MRENGTAESMIATKKRVLIVEDHPMLREGIKYTISEDGLFEIAGETSSGKHIIDLLRNSSVDIIILDISLEDINGLTMVGQIKHEFQDIKIIVYTMHNKKDYIIEAFKAGVDGYVIKDSVPSVLIKGMRKVLDGNFFIDSELAPEIVNAIIALPDKYQLVDDASYNSLSGREKEVMKFVIEGYKSREIAEKLFITEKTVETHRSHILKKLQLSNAHELFRYAEKIGLIE